MKILQNFIKRCDQVIVNIYIEVLDRNFLAIFPSEYLEISSDYKEAFRVESLVNLFSILIRWRWIPDQK